LQEAVFVVVIQVGAASPRVIADSVAQIVHYGLRSLTAST
jgi:hypothetical protein